MSYSLHPRSVSSPIEAERNLRRFLERSSGLVQAQKLKDAKHRWQVCQQEGFHRGPPDKDQEHAKGDTKQRLDPPQLLEVVRDSRRYRIVPGIFAHRKVPVPQLYPAQDARKRHAVIKAWAIVRRLWVDPHKDHDGQDGNDDGLWSLFCNELVEDVDEIELDEGKGNAEEGADRDVEEAVHAAVDSPSDHRDDVDVGEDLDGHFC